MPTTSRGYPIFTGGLPPAVPVHMQQLAEAINADLEASLTKPSNFMQGKPGAGNVDITGVTSTYVTLGGLSFAGAMTPGKIVRVTVQVSTYSTSSADVVELILLVGTTQLAAFVAAANSAGVAGSSQTHQYSGYYLVPAGVTTASVTARVRRVAGGGTVTVHGGACFLIMEAS